MNRRSLKGGAGMLVTHHLEQYKQVILSLSSDRALQKNDLLTDEFIMARSGKLEIYYAPHNEYINPSGKVMIIGLTPGFAQMRIAIEEARKALELGLPDEEVCKRAKEAARFSGSMRANLIQMLDAIGLHQYLKLSSCSELFREASGLVHTTSLLPFPVFVDKKNYSGSNPSLMSTPTLKNTAIRHMQDELEILKGALVIPLGKTVENVVDRLVMDGKLDRRQCLRGFPHPSGANGHRHKQFAARQEQMRTQVHLFFS